MTTLVKYTYLGVSSVVQVDYAEPEVRYDLATNGTSSNPYGGLDRFGRVVDLLWEKYSGTPEDLVRLQYGYDRVSNRTWREDLVAQSYSKDFDELYAYDGMHRLQDMQRGLLNSGHTAMENGTLEFQQEWSLDTTGNWSGFNEDATGSGSWSLEQTRTHNEVNEITAIAETVGPAWVTPQHDRNGNMTLMPQPANPTESFTATYDAWNRLVKLVDDSTTIAEYIYNGQNWRTQKILPEETRHFFYSSAWQVVEERLGVSADPAQQYVWGLRYIDDLILRDRDTDANGTLDERLYGIQDDNWNMVALANPSAAVQERYIYSAYGVLTSFDGSFAYPESASRVDNPYTFTSRRLDEESLLMYYRMRIYNLLVGRFMQRDPMGYLSNSNLSEYCISMPVSYVDPTGLEEDGRLGSFARPPIFAGGPGRACAACHPIQPLWAPPNRNDAIIKKLRKWRWKKMTCCQSTNSATRREDNCTYIFTFSATLKSVTMAYGHSAFGLDMDVVYGFHAAGFRTNLEWDSQQKQYSGYMKDFEIRSVTRCCCYSDSEMRALQGRLNTVTQCAATVEDDNPKNDIQTDLAGQTYNAVAYGRPPQPYRSNPYPYCSGAAADFASPLGCPNISRESGKRPYTLEADLSVNPYCETAYP